MSCASPFGLLTLVAAALSVTAVRGHVIVNEAGALIQSEVRVTRHDKLQQPDEGTTPAPLAGASFSDRLRAQVEQWGNGNTTTSKLPQTWRETWNDPHLKALSLENNRENDYKLFGFSLITNSAVVVVCFIFFAIASRLYPEMYQNNARSLDENPPGLNTAPFLPEEGLFGWVWAALQLTQDQMKSSVGVDMMMLIEFANFGLRLLILLGVPLVLVLCPVHYFCGTTIQHGEDGIKIVDKLSKVGMGHMMKGSHVFWVHVVAVWYIVLMTENQVHRAMHRFLELRVHWLLDLQPPRSTTVLVEGIPEARQSEAEMKEYFEMLFPGCVESVYIVKKTARLKKILGRLEAKKLRLEQAQEEWELVDQDPDRRPILEPGWFARLCGAVYRCTDKIQYYTDYVAKLEIEVEKERARVLEASADPMIVEEDNFGHTVKRLSEKAKAVNTHAGFVTFTSEREARLMLGMQCTASFEEWVSNVPPSAEDIIYEDLQGTVEGMKLSHTTGYLCVCFLFSVFLPLISFAGTMTNFEFFQRLIGAHVPEQFQEDAMIFLEGILAQLTLTLFMSFLPSCLMMILKLFFVLRANAWAQLKVQVWLFWFYLIFQVLVTTIEGSLWRTGVGFLKEPNSLVEKMSQKIPSFTHFYLNLMVMQWVVHIMNLTRYIQLAKYHLFSWMTGSKERGIAKTEPEDQDYYGIGNRSAQWTIVLIIGLVFSTLCPLIMIVTFITFFIIRVVYGYLIVFAEIRKPDLGGPFFVTQLWHVQYGLLVYTVLMTCVIWDWSGNNRAMMVIVAPSVAYVIFGFYHFHNNYQWESLPFEELCTEEALEDAMEEMVQYRALGENRPRYRQEELYGEMRIIKDDNNREPELKRGLKAYQSSQSGRRLTATPETLRKASASVVDPERSERRATPERKTSTPDRGDAMERRRSSKESKDRTKRKSSTAHALLKPHKQRQGHVLDNLDQLGQQFFTSGSSKKDQSEEEDPEARRLAGLVEAGSTGESEDDEEQLRLRATASSCVPAANKSKAGMSRASSS